MARTPTRSTEYCGAPKPGDPRRNCVKRVEHRGKHRNMDGDEWQDWQADDLLDKHDAAAYLGMSPHTLRNHRYHPERGTFPDPDRRIGSSDCWRRDTLDAWREEHPTNRPQETHSHG